MDEAFNADAFEFEFPLWTVTSGAGPFMVVDVGPGRAIGVVFDDDDLARTFAEGSGAGVAVVKLHTPDIAVAVFCTLQTCARITDVAFNTRPLRESPPGGFFFPVGVAIEAFRRSR